MSRYVSLCVITAAFMLALASSATAQTEPDSSYEKGGSKTEAKVVHDDGSTVWSTTWRDKSGTLREEFTESRDKSGEWTETHEWFDKTGKKTEETKGIWDAWDYEVYWRETTFTDGVIDASDYWAYDPATDKEVERRYNKSTQKYEDVPRIRLDWPRLMPLFKKEVLLQKSVYLGGAFVLEDGDGRFGTYGVEGSFVQPLRSNIGVIADAQWTRGTQGTVTYDKFMAMGGLELCPHANKRLSFDPHALAGLSRVTQIYDDPSSQNQSTNAFTFALGADFSASITRGMAFQARADYNPTFAGGQIQNNFRFSAGLRYVLP